MSNSAWGLPVDHVLHRKSSLPLPARVGAPPPYMMYGGSNYSLSPRAWGRHELS
jgi:hypothetical protein